MHADVLLGPRRSLHPNPPPPPTIGGPMPHNITGSAERSPRSVAKLPLARALKALGIKSPYYSARVLPDGSIEIVTRTGPHVYKPRTRKKRAPRRKNIDAPTGSHSY